MSMSISPAGFCGVFFDVEGSRVRQELLEKFEGILFSLKALDPSYNFLRPTAIYPGAVLDSLIKTRDFFRQQSETSLNVSNGHLVRGTLLLLDHLIPCFQKHWLNMQSDPSNESLVQSSGRYFLAELRKAFLIANVLRPLFIVDPSLQLQLREIGSLVDRIDRFYSSTEFSFEMPSLEKALQNPGEWALRSDRLLPIRDLFSDMFSDPKTEGIRSLLNEWSRTNDLLKAKLSAGVFQGSTREDLEQIIRNGFEAFERFVAYISPGVEA